MSYETEGVDRQHIDMPESHNRLIAAICRAQPNTVVVLHNGSAIALPWFDGPKAIVEAGLGGQAVGGAVVDVLSGQVNPCGKLAETYPLRLEDTPAYLNYPGEAGVVRYGEGLFVGYRYYEAKRITPRFPFGHGLSYTTFAYSELQTDQPAIRAGGTLGVTATVRNSGARAGKEVVQLYVQAQASQYRRPVKELKAFAKVALAPGKSQAVHLTLTDRDFMVYDSARAAWRMEGGAYTLLVGGSSVQVPLSATVQVAEDPQSARRVFTPLTAIKEFFADPRAGAMLMQAMSALGDGETPQSETDREMFASIPIGKLVNFGALSAADLDRVLAAVNQPPNS